MRHVRTSPLRLTAGALAVFLVLMWPSAAWANQQAPSNAVSAFSPTPSSDGYWVLRQIGAVDEHFHARQYGDASSLAGSALVVGIAPTPTGGGYWLAASDGGVFAYGDARFYGSLPALGIRPVAPIVGISPTRDGKGYWMAGADGGVFAFGDAPFLGSNYARCQAGSGCAANPPVPAGAPGWVSIVATPSSQGYWLVDTQGDVVPYGDASIGQETIRSPQPCFPSQPNAALGCQTVSAAATPTGKGLWLAGADGQILDVGAAADFGDTSHLHLAAPIVAIARTSDGQGYWLVASDGGVFTFGDAPFLGADIGQGLGSPSGGFHP